MYKEAIAGGRRLGKEFLATEMFFRTAITGEKCAVFVQSVERMLRMTRILDSFDITYGISMVAKNKYYIIKNKR